MSKFSGPAQLKSVIQMKTNTAIYVIALLVTLASASSQPYWLWQSPKPQGEQLYACSMTANGLGLAVGFAGAIVRSSNGGENWQAVYTGIDDALYGVTVAPDGKALAVGQDGALLRSDDAFITWQSIDLETGMTFTDAVWVGDRIGVIVGYPGDFVYRTIDGGETWKTVRTGTQQGLNRIVVPAHNVLVAVGQKGTVIRSTDGGLTWSVISVPTNWDLNSVTFKDSSVGVAVGQQGVILRTEDGGLTWSGVSSGSTEYLAGVALQADGNGLAAGTGGLILRTEDGGLNWRKPLSPTTDEINDVDVSQAGTYLIVGAYAEMYTSTDSGESWVHRRDGTRYSFFGVELIDPLNAIAVGYDGNVYRSTDGGLLWQREESRTLNTLNDVHSLSEDSSIVVGEKGTVLRTTNGGRSWVSLGEPSGNDLKACWYHPNGVVIAVGNRETIVRSTDHGKTWTKRPTGNILPGLYDVAFSDSLSGIAVASGGYYYLTADGGLTWTKKSVSESAHLSSVSMPTSSIIYVSGTKGGILRSSDGGQSFSFIKIGELANEASELLRFSSPDTGVVIGPNGKICETVDGGVSWSSVGFRSMTAIYAAASISQSNTVLVGASGLIRRRADAPTVTSVESSDALLKATHINLRLFPNPAAHELTIEFTEPVSEIYSVSIADVTGRIVFTKAVASSSDGGRVQLDCSDLLEGVYIVRVVNADHCSTALLAISR